MHAIGGIDLQALAGIRYFILNDFVDVCGAKAGAGVVIFFGAACHAHFRFEYLQVNRLIFIVIGAGKINRCQPVAWCQVSFNPVPLDCFEI